MKIDYQSYKKAANVSLLGLVLQLVMGLVLLVYTVISHDQSAQAASYYILCGAIVWLSLAVVFDQHRRERIEALETEALDRSGARETSVFEGISDEMRVAARRLTWMHRFLLPAASLVLAALLIWIGWYRLNWALVGDVLSGDRKEAGPRGAPISIGLVIAFVGFAFGRYVSGMGKQKVWANLRAGAAQAVGSALMGLALAVAHLVDIAGSDVVLRYLHLGIPIAMIVLGAETVLNFLLGVYRPRKPGEVPRPAFDSRVLGLVAAPDRIAESIGEAINYQFGLDVTSSWFYQLLSRSITALVLVGVVVVWGMTFVAVVRPSEQGLRIRNGHLVGEPLMPGLYAKWPWPVERVERFRVTEAQRLNLSSPPPGKDIKSVLWTNEHGVEEEYTIVQPSAGGNDNAGGGGAPGADAAAKEAQGLALLSLEVPLYYEISDIKKYEALAPAGMRQDLLKAVAQREMLVYMGTRRMDDVMGQGRAGASAALRARIQKSLAGLDAGVKVLFVGIEGLHPPIKTARNFETVVEGEQRRIGAIEKGETDKTTTLTQAVGSVALAEQIVREIDALDRLHKNMPADPQAGAQQEAAQQQKIEDLLTRAGGKAAALIQTAKAERWTMHMGRRGTAERSIGQLEAFRAAPEVYAAGVYFETLKKIMEQARVYIVADDGKTLEIRTNLEDVEGGGNVFQRPNEEGGAGGK